MYSSVIIKSKQYTDINLNAEHGMLSLIFIKTYMKCLVMQIMCI